MYLSKLEYSGVFNKHTGTFITFWLFSPPVRLYLDHYIYFFYHYVMGFAYEIYLTHLLSILIEKKSSFKNCTEMIFTNA